MNIQKAKRKQDEETPSNNSNDQYGYLENLAVTQFGPDTLWPHQNKSNNNLGGVYKCQPYEIIGRDTTAMKQKNLNLNVF